MSGEIRIRVSDEEVAALKGSIRKLTPEQATEVRRALAASFRGFSEVPVLGEPASRQLSPSDMAHIEKVTDEYRQSRLVSTGGES